jgi:hypothetical protein
MVPEERTPSRTTTEVVGWPQIPWRDWGSAPDADADAEVRDPSWLEAGQTELGSSCSRGVSWRDWLTFQRQ